METKATLYRLQRAVKSGGASWGETKYFETLEGFQEALLSGIADIEVRKRDTPHKVKQGWRRFRRESGQESVPDTTNIYSAHELVDGVWVGLNWTFTVPEVRITRKTDKHEL